VQRERMRAQLRRQLGYLERSVRLFDLGYLDEAIRIATCLRVLFHDRPRDPPTQGSLHKLLGRPVLKLRTTCKPRTFGPGTFAYDGYLHLPGNIRPWHEYLTKEEHLPVEAWWSQVIFVVDRKQVSRKNLVLWAAEKDGGAHADSRLDPGYEALLKMWTSESSGPDAGAPAVVPHQHLFALRRFALEVLASDELLALTSPDEYSHDSNTLAAWPEQWAPIMNRARDVSAVYFDNHPRKAGDRDHEAIGVAVKLVDEIRLPLVEWLADHYTRSAQYEKAIGAYTQIQTLSPGHQHSLYGLGYLHHQLGKLAEAEDLLKRAVSAAPDHLPSIYALANLYLHQDDFANARPLYEAVLDRDPEHVGARANFRILILSEKAQDPSQAVASLIELGQQYLSLGLSEAAASTFEHVLKVEPNNLAAKLGHTKATTQEVSAAQD